MSRISLAAVVALAAVVSSSDAAVIHVDDDAAPGGDGSAGNPFDTVQAAIDASVNGDTVLVADGLYRGAGNRDLDFGGRGITLMSLGGPGVCTIDADHPEKLSSFRDERWPHWTQKLKPAIE